MDNTQKVYSDADIDLHKQMLLDTRANSVLCIDTKNIQENFRFIQDKVGKNCTTAGVVKANAYGLGSEKIVPALEQAGCSFFYVGSPDEALKVAKLTNKTIAMMIGPVKGFEEEMAANHIIPVLNSLSDIEHR